MEFIFLFIFVPLCIVGMFLLFHCDLDAIMFPSGFSRIWSGFDFDDVPITAIKLLGAILLGGMIGLIAAVVWPVTLSFLGIFLLCFGSAYLLKKFTSKKR